MGVESFNYLQDCLTGSEVSGCWLLRSPLSLVKVQAHNTNTPGLVSALPCVFRGLKFRWVAEQDDWPTTSVFLSLALLPRPNYVALSGSFLPQSKNVMTTSSWMVCASVWTLSLHLFPIAAATCSPHRVDDVTLSDVPWRFHHELAHRDLNGGLKPKVVQL